METFSYQMTLPSCTLGKALLVELEKRLRFGIPILAQEGLRKISMGLGFEDHKKLEHYMIIVESKKEILNFKCTKELPLPYFERQPKKVKVEYDLCASKFITVRIIFTPDERPRVYMKTQNQQVKKMLPKIADGLCATIEAYGNRHKALHNPFVQSLPLLTIPLMVMAFGIYSEIDLFLLCSSLGWLCLLMLGLVKSLPQLFPWVTFASKHRFKLNRLPVLAKVSLLSVAVACYIAMVLLYMPRASNADVIMLASLFG